MKKPRILILDEATSAINAKREKMVQAALDGVTRNYTTITIAHRISIIQKADNIIVLRNGQAVEQGSHVDLMSNSSSVYSSLIRTQALRVGDRAEDDISDVFGVEREKILDDSTLNECHCYSRESRNHSW